MTKTTSPDTAGKTSAPDTGPSGFRVLRTLDHDGRRYVEDDVIAAADIVDPDRATLVAAGVIIPN